MFRQVIFGLLLVCGVVYADTWFSMGARQDGDILLGTIFSQTNATDLPTNQTIVINFPPNFTQVRFDLCDYDTAVLGGNEFGGWSATIHRNTTQFFAHMSLYGFPTGGNGTQPNATVFTRPAVDFQQVFLNTHLKPKC